MGNLHDARQFVDSFFAGDATAAILTIGSACGVAVAYQNRTTFECRLGRPLTDEEFAGISDDCGFDGYDELVDNAFESSDVISDWMSQILADAGLTEDDDEDDHRYNPGQCAKCGGPTFECQMTPAPADSDGFDCQECGKKAFLTDTGVAHHLNHETEDIDYDADADHVPFNVAT